MATVRLGLIGDNIAASQAPRLHAIAGARGLVNCSPVGMVGHDSTPIPRPLMRGAAWAFDAVHTPVRTRFLADADAAGLDSLSGFELFFHQGANGFEIFFDGSVDRARLRQALGEPECVPGD